MNTYTHLESTQYWLKKPTAESQYFSILSNLGCHRLLDVSLITTKKEKKSELNSVIYFLIASNFF